MRFLPLLPAQLEAAEKAEREMLADIISRAINPDLVPPRSLLSAFFSTLPNERLFETADRGYDIHANLRAWDGLMSWAMNEYESMCFQGVANDAVAIAA